MVFSKIYLDTLATQYYNCVMIPDLVEIEGSPWPVLPPGVHDTTIDAVCVYYATTPWRTQLFYGLKRGLDHLFSCGCPQAYLDGSYVTQKPAPNDYEVCWDMRFVNYDALDPVLLDFSNGRKAQKEKYFGEYFPAAIVENGSGKPFLEFFQQDKYTKTPKGIIRIVNYLLGKGGST